MERIKMEKWILIGFFALLFLVSWGGAPVSAHHGDPDSWVETGALGGCNHCHSVDIQFGADQGGHKARPSGGGVTRSITHAGIAGGRMGLPSEGQMRTHVTTKLLKTSWAATVDFMTAKEALPLPFDPESVFDYLSRCYSAAARSDQAPGTCPMGRLTVRNDCSCATPNPANFRDHNPKKTQHAANLGPVPKHKKIGKNCDFLLLC